MTTAQRAFERVAASRRPIARRGEGNSIGGARLRLVLAVAGLAALVAWGALSHLGIEHAADAKGTTSAQDAARYDGRGKWTGYTSEWRGRPQILRDAGIAPKR